MTQSDETAEGVPRWLYAVFGGCGLVIGAATFLIFHRNTAPPPLQAQAVSPPPASSPASGTTPPSAARPTVEERRDLPHPAPTATAPTNGESVASIHERAATNWAIGLCAEDIGRPEETVTDAEANPYDQNINALANLCGARPEHVVRAVVRARRELAAAAIPQSNLEILEGAFQVVIKSRTADVSLAEAIGAHAFKLRAQKAADRDRGRKLYLALLARGVPFISGRVEDRRVTIEHAANLSPEKREEWLSACLKGCDQWKSLPKHCDATEVEQVREWLLGHGDHRLAMLEGVYNLSKQPTTRLEALTAWTQIANARYDEQIEDWERARDNPRTIRLGPRPAMPSMPRWE